MYDKLTKKYGYRECDEKHILPNRKNKQNPKGNLKTTYYSFTCLLRNSE